MGYVTQYLQMMMMNESLSVCVCTSAGAILLARFYSLKRGDLFREAHLEPRIIIENRGKVGLCTGLKL